MVAGYIAGMTFYGSLAFTVPGLLLALCATRLRTALAARGASARIGVVLVQFSALGFALQGLFDARDAQGIRLHAFAWSLWWLAFAPGMLLQAIGVRSDRVFAAGCVAAALLVPGLSLVGPALLGPAIAKLAAICAWGAWWLFAAWHLGVLVFPSPGRPRAG